MKTKTRLIISAVTAGLIAVAGVSTLRSAATPFASTAPSPASRPRTPTTDARDANALVRTAPTATPETATAAGPENVAHPAAPAGDVLALEDTKTETAGGLSGITGRVAGDPDSFVALHLDGERVGGIVIGNDTLVRVRPGSKRRPELVAVERSAFPEARDDGVRPPDEPVDRAALAQSEFQGATTDPVVDLAVFYTPAAAAAVDDIVFEIETALYLANLAYQSSGLGLRVRAVTIEAIDHVEGDTRADLSELQEPADGSLDSAHSVRDATDADLVTLIGAYDDNCGRGYQLAPRSSSFAPWGFSVVDVDCAVANMSLAHELGHNMGAQHNSEDAVGPGAFEFSFGHRDPDSGFRTIMAYNDDGCCPRVPLFSDPAALFLERPLGTTQTERTDNTRTLELTAAGVASLRGLAWITPAQELAPEPN